MSDTLMTRTDATRSAAPHAAEVDGPETGALYRRVIRRETHSPRSVPAIAVAIIAALVAVWAGVELVLGLLALPALLVAPVDALNAVGRVPDVLPAALAAAGIVVALVGLILVLLAVTPGRRARHTLSSERVAVVVDNEVVASALARRASSVASIAADDARVGVSHRRAEVELTPVSGRRIDRDRVQEAVEAELSDYSLRPALRARVVVAQKAKVGG